MKFPHDTLPGYYWVLWEGDWKSAEIFKLLGRWEVMPVGSIDTVSSKEIDELGGPIVRPVKSAHPRRPEHPKPSPPPPQNIRRHKL